MRTRTDYAKMAGELDKIEHSKSTVERILKTSSFLVKLYVRAPGLLSRQSKTDIS